MWERDVNAYPLLKMSGSKVTLVSVRRVVPSSDVTTETWDVGVPGSSSMVTVSSTTSCGSCIMARDVWLLGLCSCKEDTGVSDLVRVTVIERVGRNRESKKEENETKACEEAVSFPSSL